MDLKKVKTSCYVFIVPATANSFFSPLSFWFGLFFFLVFFLFQGFQLFWKTENQFAVVQSFWVPLLSAVTSSGWKLLTLSCSWEGCPVTCLVTIALPPAFPGGSCAAHCQHFRGGQYQVVWLRSKVSSG